MFRFFRASALVIVSLLCTGCMRLDVRQTIEKDGMTTMVARYDFSAMMKAMEELGESMNSLSEAAGTGSVYKQAELIDCAGFMTDMGEGKMKKGDSFSCKDVGLNVVELTMRTKMLRSSFAVRKLDGKTIYLYRFNDSDVGLEEDPYESSKGLSEKNDFDEALVPTGSFVVTMPAPITRATVGTVKGNTVTFTLKDTKRRVVIRAEEE